MLIFFNIYLIKLCKVWLDTNLIRSKVKRTGGSTLPRNGEISYVGDEIAKKCISTRNSVGVNALYGLTSPKKRTTCPERGDAPKKPRRPGKCKNCSMEGHRRTTCTRRMGVAEIWKLIFYNLYYCSSEYFLVFFCELCSTLVPQLGEACGRM